MPRTKPNISRALNPAWLALPATCGLRRSPTRSQVQTLPFHELVWENFERLCYRLAKDSGDVEQWAVLFGGRGQKQDGIDIYLRLPDGQKYSCWQSKRIEKLTKAKLKAAIATFKGGIWFARSKEFVICSAASIQDASLQQEIEAQTILLGASGVQLKVLGQTELSTILKEKPPLVATFFSRQWVEDFCPSGLAGLSSQLDANDVGRLRAELLDLYTSNFSTLDPGAVVVPTNASSQSGLLPLLDRFVEPDVEAAELSNSGSTPLASDGSSKLAETSDLRQPEAAAPQQLQRSRERIRRQVSNWITESDCNLLIGDAGFGKSTTLRAIALDFLDKGVRFPAVAQRWPDSIPIVIPFASWVRLVEQSESNISLSSAIETWFRKFDVSNELLMLLLQSLDERRALLLIDGLDEWSNEAAAKSTLSLLSTFVRAKPTPTILTGRPSGVAKLGAIDPIWRRARLAAFSEQQQRTLASIWFKFLALQQNRLDEDAASALTDLQIKARIDSFFLDLAQSGTLLTLAGVPLLLSGLISLYLRQVILPRSRIQAYEELIQLLLEIHPSRRAQATLDRAPRFRVLTDASLRKQALAYFAYHKRLRGFDAGCLKSEAKALIAEYLQSLDGAGLVARDAIEGAKELLDVDSETAGLLIEKAPGEVGFVHAVFEETLVGLHLASWKLTDQEAFVRERAGDARWTTPILAMLYFLSRPSDVDQLLGLAVATDLRSPADFVRQGLVAEAVFGDFKCTPRFAAEWTPRFFEIVESDGWLPHREAILNFILEGGTSASRARDTIGGKLLEWFPDPHTFRRQLYEALAVWPDDELRLSVLWHGFHSDTDDNKNAAAVMISELYAGNAKIGDSLFELCHSFASAETLCAAIECLMQGWWNAKKLEPLVEAARASSHPNLRVVGIRGRIKAGKQTEIDLNEVIELTARDNLFLGFADMSLTQTLLAGWPNNARVVEIALESAKRLSSSSKMNREIAKKYLLHAAQTNEEMDKFVGELIREDKHFFMHSFGMGYRPGKYGSNVVAALDYRIAQINEHFHNDTAHLAVMSGTDTAKQHLIALLNKRDSWTFWPVYGLLQGWGMSDSEVANVLGEAGKWPANQTQYFAHHLPAIVADRTACRAKLLEIARLEKIDRLDFLMSGFARLGVQPDDTEVIDAVLELDFSDRGIYSATGGLISALSFHPEVREIALAACRDIEAPWEAIIRAFPNDPEFRLIAQRHLGGLPATLRETLVKSLGRRAHADDDISNRLGEYLLDSGTNVRTAASILYHESIASDPARRAGAVVRLTEEVKKIGPWMDMIRQAAVMGLIALDSLDTFRDMPESHGRKVDVNLFSHDNSKQALAYLAKHWTKVKASLGDEIFDRFARFGGNEWYFWDNLATYVGNSAAMKAEFIEYCSRETKALSSNALDALAREQPKSRLLLDHCKRCLSNDTPQDTNSSPFDHQRRAYVVGRILGGQFSDSSEIQLVLENSMLIQTSTAIAALAIGWKTSPALTAELGKMMLAAPGGHRYHWADAAYLVSAAGTADQFVTFVENLLENCTGYQWEFLEYCTEPMAERLHSDVALAAKLAGILKATPTSDQRASIPRLLAMANRLDADIRAWAETAFADQSTHSSVAEFGLDIVAGEIRPVAYSLLDALTASR
jgi:hypothetical protein